MWLKWQEQSDNNWILTVELVFSSRADPLLDGRKHMYNYLEVYSWYETRKKS